MRLIECFFRAFRIRRTATLMVSLMAVLVGLALTSCGSAPAPTAEPTSVPTPARTPFANSDWRPEYVLVDGYQMVRVPPGCFTMGTTDGRRDERPTSEVCIDHTFWIDRFEVTSGQYGSEGAYPGPQRPRENLTWFETRDFCQARGGRLPTEAEWEYAARGPSGWSYPWGNTFNPNNLQYDQRSLETADVGTYPAGVSWVGSHDMSGNVWEWTSSLYRSYPYNATDGRENPDDSTGKRVFRGGWLSYIDGGASPIRRFRMAPGERDWRIGFRCVVDTLPAQ